MRHTISLLATVLLWTTCCIAHGADRTIWECRTSNPAAEPILHLVEGGSYSYVKFSYMRLAAHFQADEDQRAWYWHNDGSGYYRYGLILEPDGKAWYHDFGASNQEGSEPLDYFICKHDI